MICADYWGHAHKQPPMGLLMWMIRGDWGLLSVTHMTHRSIVPTPLWSSTGSWTQWTKHAGICLTYLHCLIPAMIIDMTHPLGLAYGFMQNDGASFWSLMTDCRFPYCKLVTTPYANPWRNDKHDPRNMLQLRCKPQRDWWNVGTIWEMTGIWTFTSLHVWSMFQKSSTWMSITVYEVYNSGPNIMLETA